MNSQNIATVISIRARSKVMAGRLTELAADTAGAPHGFTAGESALSRATVTSGTGSWSDD